MKAVLNEFIDKHAPVIKKRIKGKLCPWLTQNIKKKMNTRPTFEKSKKDKSNNRLVNI